MVFEGFDVSKAKYTRKQVRFPVCMVSQRERESERKKEKERAYRGTSLIRNCTHLGPYCRTMHRALGWPQWGAAVSYERGTPVNTRESR